MRLCISVDETSKPNKIEMLNTAAYLSLDVWFTSTSSIRLSEVVHRQRLSVHVFARSLDDYLLFLNVKQTFDFPRGMMLWMCRSFGDGDATRAIVERSETRGRKCYKRGGYVGNICGWKEWQYAFELSKVDVKQAQSTRVCRAAWRFGAHTSFSGIL